jgi:NDP-sugar pyrophosphorylase family protein/aminoglycoside/choline kinase family phosphotransferase
MTYPVEGIRALGVNLSIFILAAGLGERLRPITDHLPKPLLPILGKPILQSILEKVSTLPAHKIGINLHHKKELIENWIAQSTFNKKVELFHENPILGTGGALKNAEAFLNAGTFIVHNADIVSDIDLGKLLEFHLSTDSLLTLAVHDYPEFNKLEVDERGFLREIGTGHPYPATLKHLAFTGIAVYSPHFLKFLPLGFSNVVDAWLKAIESGYKVGTFDVSGCFWGDIGTPASYASTVINELRKNGEMVYIHPSVSGCKNIEMDGYVVLEEGCKLNEGTFLRNCIFLNFPSLPFSQWGMGGFFIENCIIGPGFQIDLKESEMLGSNCEADALLIGTGGSDRQYYRIKKNQNTEILMQCFRSDPDFQRHIEYTQFFQEHAIPVPKLLYVEPEKMTATFEDLGDLSLYSFLKCPREQEEIEEVYKKVIDILILIQTVVTEHITECPLLQKRIFDYEHLRWETSYFIERFVEGIKNISVKNISALDNEFHRLALKVDSIIKTIVHRDFQSQNIIITKGRIPRVVDYQGARIGPPAYDVVSLLWDPYYRLQDDTREHLLEYYIVKMTRLNNGKDRETNFPIPPLAKNPSSPSLEKGGKGGFFNKIQFRETLLPCRLQRHMQALGAYGFLSRIKGKKYFLKYVPESLSLLKEDVSLAKDEYPELYNLVISL